MLFALLVSALLVQVSYQQTSGTSGSSSGLLASVAMTGLFSPEELIVFDCSGTLRVNPSHPYMHWALQVPGVREYLDEVNLIVSQRLKCHCPNLTDADIAKDFALSPESILGGFNASVPSNYSEKCPDARVYMTMLGPMLRAQLAQVANSSNTTSTLACAPGFFDYLNPVSYAAGQPLGWRLPLKNMYNMDASLNLAIRKCPSGAFPFLTLTCLGDACHNFLAPCNNDTDCAGGLKCDNFGLSATTVGNALNITNIYPDPFDACPSFFEAGVDNVGQWVTDKLLGVVKGVMSRGVGPATWKKPGVCGLSTITNAAKAMKSSDSNCSMIQIWSDDTIYERTSDSRLSGAAFTALPAFEGTGDGFPIISTTCTGGVSLLSSTRTAVRAVIPDFGEVLNRVEQVVKQLEACRFEPDLTTSQLLTRFIVYQPLALMYKFLPYTGDFKWGPPGVDVFSLINSSQQFNDSLPTIVLPETCSFDWWVNHGYCAFYFNGLSGLLNIDISIRLEIHQCSEGTPPSFRLACFNRKNKAAVDLCRQVFDPEVITRPCIEHKDCESEQCNRVKVDFNSVAALWGGRANDTCANSSIMSHALMASLMKLYSPSRPPADNITATHGICSPSFMKNMNMSGYMPNVTNGIIDIGAEAAYIVENEPSNAALVAGVAGGAVAIVLVGAAVTFMCCRKKSGLGKAKANATATLESGEAPTSTTTTK